MSWVGRILAWLVILGISAILAVAVLIPRVAGATPYVVLTGSMRPSMPPGTMVVVKPVKPSQIGIGTIVTYQLKSGEPAVVTHRVVASGLDGNGQPIFRTKGDANDTADPQWVRPVQIRGAKWYAVPFLGRISNLITARERDVATVLIAMALVGYALVMFAGAARDWRRSEETSTRKEES